MDIVPAGANRLTNYIVPAVAGTLARSAVDSLGRSLGNSVASGVGSALDYVRDNALKRFRYGSSTSASSHSLRFSPPRNRKVTRRDMPRQYHRRRPIRRRRRSLFRRRRFLRRRPRFRRRYGRRVFRRRRLFRGRRRFRSTFKRRQKRVRVNARGSIRSLYRKMVVGASLPWIAFGKCRYAGVSRWTSSIYGTNPSDNYIPATYQLNSLVGNAQTNAGNINYFGLFNVLYEQYIVLGAKISIHLSPQIMPSIGSATAPLPDIYTAGVPGTNVYPGYFYLRYFYPGMDGDPESQVGVLVDTNNPDSANTALAARWDREIDFLQDKSVVYTRDFRRWYSALHENYSGSTAGTKNRELGAYLSPKGTKLVFKFSAKKMYRLKSLISDSFANGSTNPFWADFGTDPSIPFFIRFGYVSFNYLATGPEAQTLQFNYPVRMDFRSQVEVDYYCAFRRPLESASTRSLDKVQEVISSRLARRAVLSPIPEEDHSHKLLHHEEDDTGEYNL